MNKNFYRKTLEKISRLMDATEPNDIIALDNLSRRVEAFERRTVRFPRKPHDRRHPARKSN